MTTECCNNLNYNNKNQQHNPSIKLILDRLTDIASYRVAMTAKNPKLYTIAKTFIMVKT